jgi:hypothetical protein
MPRTTHQMGFRFRPDIVDAVHERAREEGVSLSALVEAAIVDRLGLSPQLTDPRLRLDDHERRIEEIERMAKREGAMS